MLIHGDDTDESDESFSYAEEELIVEAVVFRPG
ncbi:hypothetical protein DSM104299_01984 [Baekduia alba]|nr:hypothetical protein DSM104299_01984 [Baekduia alba]